MYRRNPLRDPIAALQNLIAGLQTEIDEKERDLYSNLRRFYSGDIDPGYLDGNIRSVIEKLGRIAAYQEFIDYTRELIDAYRDYPESLDEMLVALKERVNFVYRNRPHAYLVNKFYDLAESYGFDARDIRFSRYEYIDQFARGEDQFIDQFYAWTFWIFDETINKLLAATRAPDYYSFVYKEGLTNERHQRMAENITQAELVNVLDHINSIITGRDRYGRDQALQEVEGLSSEDVTKLMWSNGSASWHITNQYNTSQLVNKYVHDKQHWGLMDANILVVPYPEPVVELILSSLYPLPLYGYSMEGKARKRKAGKQGPLVTDRNAKAILRSLVKNLIEARQLAQYGKIVPMNWENQAIFRNTWEKLLHAKAHQDEEAFERELRELTETEIFLGRDQGYETIRVEMPPAFYGQLKNWFDSLQL